MVKQNSKAYWKHSEDYIIPCFVEKIKGEKAKIAVLLKDYRTVVKKWVKLENLKARTKEFSLDKLMGKN